MNFIHFGLATDQPNQINFQFKLEAPLANMWITVPFLEQSGRSFIISKVGGGVKKFGADVVAKLVGIFRCGTSNFSVKKMHRR